MPSCPISNERVNERVARLVGWLVAIVAAVFLWHPSMLLLILLSIDFGARSFYRPLSIFAQIAKLLAEKLGEPMIVDAAPKIFAARIGLAMTVIAMLATATHHVTIAQAVIAVMTLCALLEGAFGYCVGCKFYTMYRRMSRRVERWQ